MRIQLRWGLKGPSLYIQQILHDKLNSFNVSERFAKSSVVLQSKLNWPIEDFSRVRSNERRHGVLLRDTSQLSWHEETEYQNLVEHRLKADSLIYDHFVKKLEVQISALGSDYMEKHLELQKEQNVLNQEICDFKKSFG